MYLFIWKHLFAVLATYSLFSNPFSGFNPTNLLSYDPAIMEKRCCVCVRIKTQQLVTASVGRALEEAGS